MSQSRQTTPERLLLPRRSIRSMCVHHATGVGRLPNRWRAPIDLVFGVVPSTALHRNRERGGCHGESGLARRKTWGLSNSGSVLKVHLHAREQTTQKKTLDFCVSLNRILFTFVLWCGYWFTPSMVRLLAWRNLQSCSRWGYRRMGSVLLSFAPASFLGA